MFRFVAIMSFFVVTSGNSMTGNFQTCQLQCNNDESGGIRQHPVTNSPPNSRLIRGKSGQCFAHLLNKNKCWLTNDQIYFQRTQICTFLI